MAAQSPDYSDDEFDFDEEYFSRTYQPLSNLPTPPPSSRESLASQSPRALLEDGGLLDSALLGPAIHLVNLVPPAVSLTAPSVTLVHEMLVRSDLPLDAIALAVCILDSLSSKFSLNWRLLCPLAQRELSHEVSVSKRHTIQARPVSAPQLQLQLHIDSVQPEVIILAALIIAFKFLEDCHEPTHRYRSAWGKDLWTCDQINVTERCIMENLGYRILPLWDPVLIADAIADMRRAARHATGALPSASSSSQLRNGEAHKRSASSAVLLSSSGSGPALPLTPAETPVEENGPTFVGGPAREAAGAAALACDGSAAAVDASMLCLPRHLKREVCPAAG